jgi:hypothetical protein
MLGQRVNGKQYTAGQQANISLLFLSMIKCFCAGSVAKRSVADKRLHAASPNGRKGSSRMMPVVQCKKVAVMGAAGGIGQPLSLLLKMNKCVTELALYDVAPLVKGVCADLSHCNTPVQASRWTAFSAIDRQRVT